MSLTVNVPMPEILSVSPYKDYRVRVKWGKTLRPRDEEIIDLSPLIETLKFYRPLRGNRKLLGTVHVTANGNAIAWGDESIDMAATSVERLAEEAMTPDDFRVFLAGNGLTQDRAAVLLGRSRRQIANYANGKQMIPRIVVLACYGYLARAQQQTLGGIRDGSNVAIGRLGFKTTRLRVIEPVEVAA